MLALPMTMGDLWPSDAVIVQRVADDSRDWLPQSPTWCDRSSVSPLPLAGPLPIICHQAGVTPGALQLLRDCGLSVPEAITPYRDFDDLRGIVEGKVRSGRRIGITYTSRGLLAPAEAYVNHPALVADLNDKALLASLVPGEAVPARCVVDINELPRALRNWRGRLPLVLKASTRLGSGGGRDVVVCRCVNDVEDAYRRLARAERVVIEAFYIFTDTWCLHFGVGDGGPVYCGASEQICDDAGVYHGNWCVQGAGPAEEAIDMARHAAREGWRRGYRGFLGVDAGRTADGRWLVFDLNFRNNGSTSQVLLRHAVADECAALCTRFCPGVKFDGSFAAMLEALWRFHRRRELVPLLAFDTEQAGTAETKPVCNLLVAGATHHAVGTVLVALREAGFEVDHAPVKEPVGGPAELALVDSNHH